MLRVARHQCEANISRYKMDPIFVEKKIFAVAMQPRPNVPPVGAWSGVVRSGHEPSGPRNGRPFVSYACLYLVLVSVFVHGPLDVRPIYPKERPEH